MLTIRIQKDHPRDLSILPAARIRSAKPVRESSFNCLAFALVLSVNNNFGACFARALFRLIGGAVINNENVIQAFAGPTRDVADVFFVLIGRNNRRGLRSNIFCHVERSRLPSRRCMRRLETSQYLVQRLIRSLPFAQPPVFPSMSRLPQPLHSSTALRFAPNDKHCNGDAVACAVLSASI